MIPDSSFLKDGLSGFEAAEKMFSKDFLVSSPKFFILDSSFLKDGFSGMSVRQKSFL